MTRNSSIALAAALCLLLATLWAMVYLDDAALLESSKPAAVEPAKESIQPWPPQAVAIPVVDQEHKS